MMESGFCSVPLINDDDFEINDDDEDEDENKEEKKMTKRNMLKEILKDEIEALKHCKLIVEELGFLKYIKDDETYIQLQKTKQNALKREMELKKKKKQQNEE
eukprot:149839_1